MTKLMLSLIKLKTVLPKNSKIKNKRFSLKSWFLALLSFFLKKKVFVLNECKTKILGICQPKNKSFISEFLSNKK